MRVNDIAFPLRATLATVELSSKEKLQVGDILVSEHKIEMPVEVAVHNNLVFRGFMGTKDSKKALLIKEVV